MCVKPNGEMVCLWRAVDDEGAVLESSVTKARDKAAVLTFMKKARLRAAARQRRSLSKGCAATAQRSTRPIVATSKRSDAGGAIGSRIAACRSDVESERCCGSGR